MARNKYPEETVQKILDVSLRLFLEKGYEQTTVLDIVEQLGGMTRGAFYHHFKSKDEVVNALGDRMFFDQNPFAVVEKEEALSGLEKIQRVILLQYENTLSVDIGIMSMPMLKNPRMLVELIESNQTMAAPLFCRLFEEGIRDGSIKGGSAKALSELFMLVGNFWMIPTIFPATKEEFRDRLVLLKNMFDGIGVPIINEEVFDIVMKVSDRLCLDQVEC